MWRGIDKRKFPRANYKCSVVVRRPKGQMTLSAQTENVGVGGICILTDNPLDIFSEVELELALGLNAPPINCRGSVVWVVKRAAYGKNKVQKYDTGIEFLDLSQDDRDKIEKIIEEITEKEKPE